MFGFDAVSVVFSVLGVVLAFDDASAFDDVSAFFAGLSPTSDLGVGSFSLQLLFLA